MSSLDILQAGLMELWSTLFRKSLSTNFYSLYFCGDFCIPGVVIFPFLKVGFLGKSYGIGGEILCCFSFF